MHQLTFNIQKVHIFCFLGIRGFLLLSDSILYAYSNCQFETSSLLNYKRWPLIESTTNISVEDFIYITNNLTKPVLIKDEAKHWKALHAWKNSTYIKEVGGKHRFMIELRKRNYDDVNQPRTLLTMDEYLKSHRSKPMYLASELRVKRMLDDLEMLSVWSCDVMKLRSVHLLHSSGGTVSPLHHDVAHNFLTIVSGVKKILLADVSATSLVYPIPGHVGVSAIDVENVDWEKHPRARDINFRLATVTAGSTLFIPEGWWHVVWSSGDPNIAVNYWWYARGDTRGHEDYGGRIWTSWCL